MKIPILHLEEGYHHFSGVIKGGSLNFYRNEVYPRDLSVEVDLNKFEKNISCQISISTLAHYQCDRCLAEYDRNFSERLDILFHVGPQEIETDEDEVVSISPDLKEIDITLYIEECLIVSIPMKLLCKESCKGICAGCGADLNTENCKCAETPHDSRWDKLMEIKKSNRK
ncbi:MAG: DUF177 domain-containing protein [bacterium]|nr:MAG: DUF177 domain-containing protein [bacterium]